MIIKHNEIMKHNDCIIVSCFDGIIIHQPYVYEDVIKDKNNWGAWKLKTKNE